MNNSLENKRQDLARKLVQREVGECLSMLVSDLAKFEQGEYYDEVMDAFSVPDYEEALANYIDNADIDELELLIEENGYWHDFLAELRTKGLVPAIEERTNDETGEHQYRVAGGEVFDDEDGAVERSLEIAMPAIREAAKAHVSELCADDQRGVCDTLDIDYHEYDCEVYEHWSVSSWLGAKLEAQGHNVIGLYGMTVWGRCTTGQSISMDGVIRGIAAELWPEEWNGKES